jgi:hypothetical protein
MSDSPVMQRVLATARGSIDGKFYLRRRLGRRIFGEPVSEQDLEWDACEYLVAQGRAVWLDQTGPGIMLVAQEDLMVDRSGERMFSRARSG